ncbi:MAG: CPBP family intramembrane metalloprotease [Candidatus Bathyarchaeota archaeon]|nr:MAG: CPBP family intramembrane metalloprotease [Candidatus Bathyarchaeota archaeon]
MKSNISEALQKLFSNVVIVISLFIILTYLLSMGMGILVVFSTPEGLQFTVEPFQIHPLLLLDVGVTVNAGVYFLFLWWIFIVCFGAAWRYRESLTNRVREFFSGPVVQNPFSNNLLAMPLITSMLLVFTIVLAFLQSQAGIPTGELPQGDPFQDFLGVSRAPLVEELIFRIIPIGAFLATFFFVAGARLKPTFSRGKRLKIAVLGVLQPERAKEMLGLSTIREQGLLRGLIWAEWIMVVLTALLFGLAHYYGGWGPGKISQAAISGLIFAVAYLYYGIQAPILLHWFFNYYFNVFYLSLNYYSSGVDLLFLSWSANFFLGILLWLAIMISGVYKAMSIFLKTLRRPSKISPDSVPPSTSILHTS